MRPLLKVAAVVGAVSVGLFALMALAQPPIQWGVIADSGFVVLLDAGVQNSIPVTNPFGTDVILCYVQDAGAAAPATGSVSLYGSDNGTMAHAVQISTTLSFSGGPGAVAWDSLTTAEAYLIVQIDAGAASGFMSCTINSGHTN
jgi:hypothetical protein